MTESTRSVERAIDILLCFNREEPVLTLTQIAEQVKLHKSTVHRLLATLESRRFVQRDESNGSYRLGMRLVELGFSVRRGANISDYATPHMQRLSLEHRETVDLAILEESDVVYLEVIESPQRMKIAAAPGERLPAFCTATGKAFLAFMPDTEVSRIFKESVRKYTNHTSLTFADLSESLYATRARGYAVSEGEYEDGINAVASPILDVYRCPIAAIAVVGPAFRLSSKRMMVLGKSVKATTDTIAREIRLTHHVSTPPASPDTLIGKDRL